ncbi:MAG: urease accessory protein UreD [Gammaproteobacteria bacterium]
MAEPVLAAGAGWQATLQLAFAPQGARSVLARRQHSGPLQVQRPFYPEGAAVCHVYLLHPPGGVVGGDSLQIDVAVAGGAHALITTPAANKLYRSSGAEAHIEQRLKVDAGATLEWLPQETITFNAARAQLSTRVELTGDAGFIGWELLCLGRPASGERYSQGSLRSAFEIHRAGTPVWIERARYAGDDGALTASWGLRGHVVTGTLVCIANAPVDLAIIRAALMAHVGDGLASATQLDGALVCRYLGDDIEAARRGFVAVWQTLRPLLLGRLASLPRIWAT